MKLPLMLSTILMTAPFWSAGVFAADFVSSRFLVTNDDSVFANTVTFYHVGADGSLTQKSSVATGGTGVAGGSFAADRVAVVNGGDGACVYVADAGSSDVAGFVAKTGAVSGNFKASQNDSGTTNGIGLAVNANYLYASFTGSSTIATFQTQAGCMLTFLGDVSTSGLNKGWTTGMAIHGGMMVVTYGDGTIESFNISAGVPVPNGDKQLSTGYNNDHLANGVDITKDGHYAIFGDSSTVTTIEVSDISSGKLTPTIAYDLNIGWNSGRVLLSPDETMLYITNSSSGGVTAAFFDKTTGKITRGCSLPSMKGFYSAFSYAGEIVNQLATGTGGVLYVAEFGGGGSSRIALVGVTSGNGSCTLAELNSPVTDSSSTALLSIGLYPPRPF